MTGLVISVTISLPQSVSKGLQKIVRRALAAPTFPAGGRTSHGGGAVLHECDTGGDGAPRGGL